MDDTVDGEQDPHWSSDGRPYEPEEWGDTAERPTACEQIAMIMKENM